jgi:S1-C subfamily serine protease
MNIPPLEQKRDVQKLLRSVVKILTVSDAPDYDQPWQTRGPSSTAGSGVIISTARGPRVLTNAHCVENYAFVEARRYGNAHRFVAEVEAIGYECDLALLRIPDESFFAGTVPIPLGTLPDLSDEVSVFGYPIGGERLSITNGVVSRIESIPYAHRQRRLLAVQVDAAINAGNSGGPVLKDGAIVGVAFQALEDADQIGYMIAVPVIEHFLRDVEDGSRDGFPSLGIRAQALESDAHRRFLGLPAGREGGVLITQVAFQGSAWGTLERGDVLLSVDGVPIASDGTVEFRDGEMLSYDYVISRRHVGDTVECRVWRQGAELACVVRLRPPQYLVAEDRYDSPPTYYIYGGLLFAPLTRDYLKTWEDWWHQAPRSLVALYERGFPTPERTEAVILQKVLADAVNQGYSELESLVVERVNGEPVKNLRHLIEMVETSRGDFVQFETTHGLQIVLDRAEVRTRHPVILERFKVPQDRSPDLLAPKRPLPAPARDPRGNSASA